MESICENNQNIGEEGVIMLEEPQIQMTRKQIYDEIWEISVAGLAKKYGIQYTWLLRQVKEANIPIPPSGYWAKLNHGKLVTKPELPEPLSAIITISKAMPTSYKTCAAGEPSIKKEQAFEHESKTDLATNIAISSVIKSTVQDSDSDPSISKLAANEQQSILETSNQCGKTYNIYDRETLYKEVWEQPVTEVAKRYRVSDVAIHKVCKSLDIPTPPLGYWAKLRAGKPVAIVPLPDSGRTETKAGLRTEMKNGPELEREVLTFLSQEERDIILSISRQIIMPDENAKMHPKIIAHRKSVSEWKKLHKEKIGRSWNARKVDSPPFLAETVSEASLPRVCHILDAFIKAMEPLGCSLTKDLRFIVNNETVPISVTESKDEIKHVLTKEENMQLLKYEEERRRYPSAYKPNIRKYDHPYNGRISLSVNSNRGFRDCKSYVIEDKLGDILIDLYEAADVIRRQRESREEAERKRIEEEHLREEKRKRYNKEVERTVELTNLAEDYDTSCKIRRYINAVASSDESDENALAWIEWAKNKADWYDPIIAREDEFLGKREHTKDKEQKVLKRPSWWEL